jgi:hypothetical protein
MHLLLKLLPYIVDHKHINFDKHASLLRNPYITNKMFYSTGLQAISTLV